MINLARLRKERNEIALEALELIPRHHKSAIIDSITHLAQCYVIDRERGHLADIQALIDAARAENLGALTEMKHQLNKEIDELRRGTQQGFEQVEMRMGKLHQRVEVLEKDPNQRLCN